RPARKRPPRSRRPCLPAGGDVEKVGPFATWSKNDGSPRATARGLPFFVPGRKRPSDRGLTTRWGAEHGLAPGGRLVGGGPGLPARAPVGRRPARPRDAHDAPRPAGVAPGEVEGFLGEKDGTGHFGQVKVTRGGGLAEPTLRLLRAHPGPPHDHAFGLLQQ